MSSRPGLVSPDELATELAGSNRELRVVDLRQQRDNGVGKIPGSSWIGLHDGFAQARPARNFEYDLPSPAEFADALSRLGIRPDSSLVLADDMGNRWSTRVYWLPKYYRHPGDVAVLDGGIAAWLRSGHRLADEFATSLRTAYPAPTASDESIRATSAQVLEGIAAGELTMADVRTPEEYRGEVVRSGRGGHIPTAVNVPWDRCLAADGTFLPHDQLADVLAPYLDLEGQPVTYCQGGVRASLVWFALQVLLARPARMYAASWEEWSQAPDLPVAL